MTIIPTVIAWAFTLTFLIALVLILLDVAGVRRIADETQRKWLFRSLLGSVIMAVTGFGAWQFEAFRRPAEPAPQQAVAAPKETPPAPEGPSPPAPAQDDRSRPPSPPAPPAVRPADAAAETIAPEVRAWADEALGARPVLSEVVDGHYPGCAEQLRPRPMVEIALSDARACRQKLNRFNDLRLVAYYNLKRPYDHHLE